MLGKIVKGIAGFYYVHTPIGTMECKAKGSFRREKMKPSVGDMVEIKILDGEAQTGNIEKILPRKNCLIRPAVSNVDQALVIFASLDPEPNLNLLDRFLVMMEKQNVPTAVCFNKTDLADGDRVRRLEKAYQTCGYPVHFISVKHQDGLLRIREGLRHKTTVLAGPSGVGKSSLINFLIPDANMETGAISEKIRRGKHTTRHSEFFCMEEDTYILDTPGFSSIYLEDIKPEELKEYFPEFSAHAERCRFKSCVHVGEKECGVKDAVCLGEISRSRYENYVSLYQELKEKKRYEKNGISKK